MTRPTIRNLAFGIGILSILAAGCGGGDDNPAGPGDNEPVETLKITSIEPAHGSIQVGEEMEIRIEFDRPVIGVGAIMVPDLRWMDQDWLFRSEDSTTYSRVINLEEDQAYQLIVFGAVGADSTYLDEAEMIAFTTSETLPTGIVSGIVETPNSYSAEGTVLFLVDATHWIPGGAGTNLEDHITAFGFVAGSAGDYRIENVESGNYYLYAFKDVSADGAVDNEKDLFGFYGIDGFEGFLAINVRNDQETSGIDFPVLQGNGFF